MASLGSGLWVGTGKSHSVAHEWDDLTLCWLQAHEDPLSLILIPFGGPGGFQMCSALTLQGVKKFLPSPKLFSSVQFSQCGSTLPLLLPALITVPIYCCLAPKADSELELNS